MKLRLLTLLCLVSFVSCSTTDKSYVANSAPIVTAVADAALTASGYGGFVGAFNALSGMALALYEGNDPVAASGNPAVAKAVLAVAPNVSAATLTAAATTLQVP